MKELQHSKRHFLRGFAGVCRAVGERTPKILNAVGNGDRGYGDPPGERPDRPARPHGDDQLDLARARHFGHVLPWVFLDSRRSIICYCMRWRDDSCIFSPPQQVGVDSVDPLRSPAQVLSIFLAMYLPLLVMAITFMCRTRRS